ncbi:MAG: hypothetical protein LC096_08350 [Bacteroidia bacterium]|nr:hypothetical protein [Bacteroidia bacterium]
MSKKKILENAIRKLNPFPCSTHSEKPSITNKGNDNFEIKYCCEQYASIVQKQLDKLVSKEIEESINAMFKKGF